MSEMRGDDDKVYRRDAPLLILSGRGGAGDES